MTTRRRGAVAVTVAADRRQRHRRSFICTYGLYTYLYTTTRHILRYAKPERLRSSLNLKANNNLPNNDANYEMLNEF